MDEITLEFLNNIPGRPDFVGNWTQNEFEFFTVETEVSIRLSIPIPFVEANVIVNANDIRSETLSEAVQYALRVRNMLIF